MLTLEASFSLLQTQPKFHSRTLNLQAAFLASVSLYDWSSSAGAVNSNPKDRGVFGQAQLSKCGHELEIKSSGR
jgi:hypothetical protein